MDERLVHAEERRAVANGTTQNATNDVTGARVGRELPVGDGKSHGADVVSNDSERDGFLAFVLGVRLATRFRDGVQKRRENVGIVVRCHPLQGHGQALKAHAGVDVLVGKGDQGTVRHAVEFHEDEVPNLNDLGMVFVHQRPSVGLGTFVFAAKVDVDFRARPTRPCLAHLPEVVFFVGSKDAVVGDVFLPLGTRFVVCGKSVTLVTAKDGHVKAVFVQTVTIREQFPRPVDGFGFEVVPKRPVAEHFEEGVVVGVHADFLQVVVLSTDAKAFLGVGNASMLHRLVAQKQILEWIHASIDEHQGGVVFHHHGCRGHDLVSFFLEKIQKSLSDAA